MIRTVLVFVAGYLLGLWLRELAAPDIIRPRRAVGDAPHDPLTEISGIGPVYEQALNEIGIFTFARLALENADSLSDRLDRRVSSERIRREQWVEQARERAGD